MPGLPVPTQKVPQQPPPVNGDYLQQAGIAVAPGNEAEVKAINTYLASLSDSDRQSAIQLLQGGSPLGPLGDMTIPWGALNPMPTSTLQQLFQKVQAQYKPAASSPNAPTAETENVSPTGAVSTTAVGTGTPVEGSTQATALINQYMTTPLWQGDPDDPQGAAQGLGIDYNSANTQYQAYLANYGRAQQRANIQGAMPQPMSEVQFIQGLAQTQYGQWGPVIGMLAYAWQEQNGTPMPPALAQEVLAGLKNIPANDSAQLQTQMLNSITQIENAAKQATAKGGQVTDLNLNVELSSFLTQLSTYAPSVYSGSGSSSGGASLTDASPGSIVGQYITANPQAAGVEATQKGSQEAQAIEFLANYGIPTSTANVASLSNAQTYSNMQAYVSWMQGVGMPITASTLESLMAMPFSNPNTSTVTAGTGGAWLLDQMVPGTKMTYGAYQQVSSSITPQWEQYFNSAPTKAQLAYFVGKSSTDVNDYFSNSMSSIPGITIGQKNDYENFINSLDQQSPTVNGITHTFSSQLDDSMMDQLHQAVTSQSTGAPTPGPMK